jgi:cytochrome c553
VKRRHRTALKTVAATALVAGVAGLAVAWAGLVPVAASSGHWQITAWFLHWTLGNTVRTQALGVGLPPDIDLDDAALIRRGAGHYESGCAPCHGSPGSHRSVVARQMTPEPPYLPRDVAGWTDRELFWIIRNGIKFTGMPAWPAFGREDEVWSMVAFVRRLPTMDATRYRHLAGLPPAGRASERIAGLDDSVGSIVATSCSRCHGADGLGRGEGGFPRIAGQREAYLRASLTAYRAGERHSGFMQPVASGLTDEAIARLSAYYAGLPRGSAVPAAGDVTRGERIATSGLADRGVPACLTCHGPKAGPRAAIYPELAGQVPSYIVGQLEAFRQGDRGGTPYAPIMRHFAGRLTREDMQAVAAYFASRGPDRTLGMIRPIPDQPRESQGQDGKIGRGG